MSDIFKSLMEEPPKKKKICALFQLTNNPCRPQEAHAPTTNVHHTLLFAVLLNNEDGNCLINQAWIPFGMSHWHHFRT